LPHPLVIAHRGDSAHRPENTLASFASALELGAELVEFDVQLTRDGEVVVLHDPTLDRTTTGRGPVREHTLAEVRRLSAGYPARFGDLHAGERIPTLREVLGLLRGRARALVEIKPESVTEAEDDGVEARAAAEVRRAGLADQTAFLSFSRPALLRCRRLAPEVPRGHLFFEGSGDDMVRGAREAETDFVMPEKRLLSPELVARLKAADLRVATWVVDEPDELAGLRAYGLFGVATNRPGVLMGALAEWTE
jgi:glycerophosphoryl diester phosphodiesterase